ncbi:MAG: hypothetical protein C5B59_14140 [Bacteroidetes bacterium]|nr:MAG: hypothetical protein C5B59_14140 [Bacteroidota bacterium]
MVIWKGYGILALVIAIAIGALTSYAFSKIGSTEDLGAAVGALISAIVIWVVGNKLNSPAKARTMVDKQTGQEVTVKPNHSLFFIKMQYWAFIIGAIGLVLLIKVAVHGDSSS